MDVKVDQVTGVLPRLKWDDPNMKTSYANVCNVASTREEVTLLIGNVVTDYEKRFGTLGGPERQERGLVRKESKN